MNYNYTQIIGTDSGKGHLSLLAFDNNDTLQEYIQIHGQGDIFAKNVVITPDFSIYLSLTSNGKNMFSLTAPVINNEVENIDAVIKLNASYIFEWIKSTPGIEVLAAIDNSLVMYLSEFTGSDHVKSISILNSLGSKEHEIQPMIAPNDVTKFSIFDSEIYFTGGYGMFQVDFVQDEIKPVLALDMDSKVLDFIIAEYGMAVIGETSHSQLIEHPTFQTEIVDTHDLYVLSYHDLQTLHWGTYFGGMGYEVSYCLN